MKNLLVTDILICLIKQTVRLYPKERNKATYKYVPEILRNSSLSMKFQAIATQSE